MAWRPYENLIAGELDNHLPGKVVGWMRFYRRGKRPLKVTLDLAGDFHEDIRGKVIRLTNPSPSDRCANLDRAGTYMEGFSVVQQGEVGDITAGLALGPWTEEIAKRLMTKHEISWDEAGLIGFEREVKRKKIADFCRARIEAADPYYPYVDYPYIEWYSEANGRVVLELGPLQLEVVKMGASSLREKTSSELARDERNRIQAMRGFLSELAEELSDENRKHGGDGNVSSGLVG